MENIKSLDKLREVRGMSDLIGEDLERFCLIENVSAQIAERYCFSEIRTPIVEYNTLFERGLGADSDIISKEMYTFQSRSGEGLTLRPEFTSSIARVIASRKLTLPAKIFCYGPVFRYERPQKGRRRQFHQINFESMGVNSEVADAELIFMALEIIKSIGINTDKVELNINSLGDQASVASYRSALVEFLKKYESSLSDDSKRRLITNPLRILDSKDEQDIRILTDAPEISSYWTPDANKRFNSLLEILDKLSVSFVVNSKLVRGLDYYTSTVFEFVTAELGAQGTILAGGRYDELVKSMGGPEVPAVGFAGGIERLAELAVLPIKTNKCISLIPIGNEAENMVIQLACSLRSSGFCIDFDYESSTKNRMKKAGTKAVVSVIFGTDEIQKNVFTVRNMSSGEQSVVESAKLVEVLLSMLNG